MDNLVLNDTIGINNKKASQGDPFFCVQYSITLSHLPR